MKTETTTDAQPTEAVSEAVYDCLHYMYERMDSLVQHFIEVYARTAPSAVGEITTHDRIHLAIATNGPFYAFSQQELAPAYHQSRLAKMAELSDDPTLPQFYPNGSAARPGTDTGVWASLAQQSYRQPITTEWAAYEIRLEVFEHVDYILNTLEGKLDSIEGSRPIFSMMESLQDEIQKPVIDAVIKALRNFRDFWMAPTFYQVVGEYLRCKKCDIELTNLNVGILPPRGLCIPCKGFTYQC